MCHGLGDGSALGPSQRVTAPQVMFIHLWGDGPGAGDAPRLACGPSQLDAARNRLRHVHLKEQHVPEFGFEDLGPEVRLSRSRVDELDRDAHATTGSQYGPDHKRVDVQGFRDLRHRLSSVLELHDRRAGDDAEVPGG